MKTILLLLILINLSACFEKPESLIYKKASQALHEGDQKTALKLLKKTLLDSQDKALRLSAAKDLSQIYLSTNQYEQAKRHLQYVVVHSPNQKEVIAFKQKMADTEFFYLKNYAAAVDHYWGLVELGVQTHKNRLMLAKGYYHLNNMSQAKFEIDTLLKEKIPEDIEFDVLLLSAHLHFSAKKYDRSSEIYQSLVDKYPDRSKKDQVLLNLAMSYEENHKYKQAVKALQELQPHYHSPEFIAAKIGHIKRKMRQMPGARGLKR